MPTTRRPPSSSSWFANAAALVVLAALLTSCGGDDAEARAACETQALKAAEARVVAEFYDRGELGTRSEIEREIDHPSLRFFDGSGRMLPYEQLTPAAQAVFNRWVANTRVGDVTAEEREQARNAVEPDC